MSITRWPLLDSCRFFSNCWGWCPARFWMDQWWGQYIAEIAPMVLAAVGPRIGSCRLQCANQQTMIGSQLLGDGVEDQFIWTLSNSGKCYAKSDVQSGTAGHSRNVKLLLGLPWQTGEKRLGSSHTHTRPLELHWDSCAVYQFWIL